MSNWDCTSMLCTQKNLLNVLRHRLIQHQKSHRLNSEQQQTYSCDICKYKINSKAYFNDHNKRMHKAQPGLQMCIDFNDGIVMFFIQGTIVIDGLMGASEAVQLSKNTAQNLPNLEALCSQKAHIYIRLRIRVERRHNSHSKCQNVDKYHFRFSSSKSSALTKINPMGAP